MDKDFRAWILEMKKPNGTQISSDLFFSEEAAKQDGEARLKSADGTVSYEVHEVKRAGKKRGTK